MSDDHALPRSSIGRDYYANRRQKILQKRELRLAGPSVTAQIETVIPPSPEPMDPIESVMPEPVTTKLPVVVVLATFPPRRQGMLRTVNDLLPQCDVMCLYLNGYTEVPEELKKRPDFNKLEIVLAGPGQAYPDISSNGKHFWLDKYTSSYYLTVDDDIFYPKDYCLKMCQALDRYGHKAIVSMHGIRYKLNSEGQIPNGALDRAYKSYYMYDRICRYDTVIHIPGNGCCGRVPSAISMTRANTEIMPLNSGDDGDMGLFGQRNQVPIIRIASPARWLTANATVWPLGALHMNIDCVTLQDAKHRSYEGPWRLYPAIMQGPGQALPEAILSVSMPTCKTPAWMLLKAVQSVLDQTETRLRLYVVNDDEDQACWAALAKITDPRLVRVQMPTNTGTYACHSLVLGLADTKWFTVVDSDDYVEPTRFDNMLKHSRGKDAVLGAYTVVNGNNQQRVKPESTPKASTTVPCLKYISVWAGGLWSTDWLRRAGGINPTFRCGYDSVLQSMAIRFGRYRVVEDYGYFYVKHGGSLTTSAGTGFNSQYRRRVYEILNKNIPKCLECNTLEDAASILKEIKCL